MPVYDYRCDHCGHAFEATGGFNDPQLSACPRCGKPPRRLISATAIVFKGSGWYKTDSRSAPTEGGDAKPAATGAKATATADGASAGAKSGEAKPGDAKAGDATSGDAKSGPAGPAKSGDAKSAGSKAATAPASAPKAPAKGKPASSG